MVIKLEQQESLRDIEILISYPKMSKNVEHIVSIIKSVDIKVAGLTNDGFDLINASDILYIESIDDKTHIFCEKNNYQIKERLYNIYEKLKNVGFIQINKYCILNIRKLYRVRTLKNSHLEAVLFNGNSLYVTRKYLAEMKHKLREMLV